MECQAENVATEFHDDSGLLVVSFGAMHGNFEFVRAFTPYAVNKLFIKDLHRAWYHGGVPSVAEDFDGLAQYIKGIMGRTNIERTIMIGSSGAGYAALLLGHLCDADEVHAFVPQTTLDPDVIKKIGDKRKLMLELYPNIYAHENTQPHFYDLLPVLICKKNIAHHIYYATTDELDIYHALRMNSVPGVVFHKFDKGGHNLLGRLKKDGELEPLLKAIIEGNQ